jgi:serine/threonine-protein kinase
MATSRAPTTVRGTQYTRHSDRSRAVAPDLATDAAPDAAADVAFSAESGRSYRLDRLIGKGGFGEVYLATPTPMGAFSGQVCVKVTDRLTPWLREAYFAELLAREDRALRVYDRFVEMHAGQMRYCLVMEYAEHGDLGAWLAKRGAQSERFVRREIAAILSALDALHRGHAMHRDLTPFNVFVCEGEQLKLGDFGIAAHQRNSRGVTADAFNLFHVPNEIAWGKVRRWQKRDDVYQIGLLAAMLLRGDIVKPMVSKEVRGLPCSDQLKEVIHRCLGSRGKRYEAANDLIAALKTRVKEPRLGRVKSLAGKHVSFTGFLVRPRADAIRAAKNAGAVVQSKPGQTTDILVRGRPNAQQIAGKDGGSKLIEVRRLAALGVKVTVIDERQFWRLAEAEVRRRVRPLARSAR